MALLNGLFFRGYYPTAELTTVSPLTPTLQISLRRGKSEGGVVLVGDTIGLRSESRSKADSPIGVISSSNQQAVWNGLFGY